MSNVENKKLVLLWGWGRNDKSHERLINSAPKNWEIYTLLYHEVAPKADLKNRIEKVLEFIDKNDIPKASFLGHSIGAALALEFAYHFPEKVENLYLADSEGVPSTAPVAEAMKAFTGSYRKNEGVLSLVKYLLRISKNPIFHFKLGRYAHFVDLQEEAKRIKVPTTLFWGEKDGITPLWQGERLQSLIPNSKMIVFPNEGHDWIVYNPELFWKNVK